MAFDEASRAPVSEIELSAISSGEPLVPFEPAIFGAAANNGQMVVEMAPESRSGLAIDQLAQALCGREPVAPKKTSMLDRLPALLKR